MDFDWILGTQEEINADYQYYQKEVEVYRVSFMDGTMVYTPKDVGESIRKAMVEATGSSVITLGNGTWRLYEVKSVIPEIVRFCELSEWAQHKILENDKKPGLFHEWYDQFSPSLKKWIKRLKEGKDISHELKLEKK